MQKRHVNIILGVLAFFVVCAVLLVAGGAWFLMSVMDHQEADEQQASAAFTAARARFPGAMPVFELGPDGPALTRPVPETPRVVLHTMHVLNWSPEDQTLTRADLPFSLLRLKEGPIDIAAQGRPGFSVRRGGSIQVSDIERFGPALLMDLREGDGHRILIWTD
jgi:hypothetical protein